MGLRERFCRHEYKDSNLTSTRVEGGVLLENRCIKCGAPFSYLMEDPVIDAQIAEDIKRFGAVKVKENETEVNVVMARGIEETIIIRNSKMVYAVRLQNKEEGSSSGEKNNKPYLIVENGAIKFLDRIYDSKAEFNFSDEVHQIAKEVFISGLRATIKEQILQLKQLSLILEEMGLKDCLGDTVTVNAKMLVQEDTKECV